MAACAVADGIHTIVATPHTLNGIFLNPIHDVQSRVKAFRDTLRENDIRLKVYAGADVHLCPGMPEKVESGEAGTINNAGKYLLLELPSQSVPRGVKDEIFALKLKGITPIITHPERNLRIIQDIRIVHELVSMGALCQVTAMSITGDFGEIVAHCAERLIINGLVHVIASDAHSADNRPPVLSKAVERTAEILGSFDEAERLVGAIPDAIIAGKPVEVPEPKRPK